MKRTSVIVLFLAVGFVFAASSFSCSKKRVPLNPDMTVTAIATATAVNTLTNTATTAPTAGNTPTFTATATTYVPASQPWTFDANTEGFLTGAAGEMAVTSIIRNTTPSGITHGAGSLAININTSSAADAKGYVYIDLLPAPLDLTGKKFSYWVNVPAGMVGCGMQMVAKTGTGKAWNASWKNLDTAGWVKFTWDVNLADVTELGMQILRNSGPSFTGVIYTDEWTITDIPPASTAVYSFDLSSQGWANDLVTDLAISVLAWDNNAANAKAGAGCIALTADFSTSMTAQGYFYVDLAATPLDLTGKTVDIWINVPAAMVGYGAQVACKTGAGKAWNAGWNNISASGWQKMTWDPNLADVQEIGLQILRNNAAGAFSGTLYADEITYY